MYICVHTNVYMYNVYVHTSIYMYTCMLKENTESKTAEEDAQKDYAGLMKDSAHYVCVCVLLLLLLLSLCLSLLLLFVSLLLL